jgi:5-methylcytosine-specific restriction protein A
MPKRIKRPCRSAGCAALHRNGTGYCDDHKSQATGWHDYNKPRGNRHARGYGADWVKLRQEIIQRDKNLCQICLKSGRHTNAHAVDHIKPKAHGGTDDPSNLRCVCQACHAAKTAVEWQA